MILEIHKGNPLCRDIFADSIALSTSLRELSIRFDWAAGYHSNLHKVFKMNKVIRKMSLELANYDNKYDLFSIIRLNNWIKTLNLDVFFTDGLWYKNMLYKPPMS